MNYTGFELLRKIETSKIKYSSGILPSTSLLQKYTHKVELIEQELYHIILYAEGNELGKGFRYNFENYEVIIIKL